MHNTAIRKPRRLAGASVMIGTALCCAVSTGAQAQTAESPAAVSSVARVEKGVGRQLWRISDYSTVELVARERGASDNQHPWQVEPATLQALLEQVQVIRAGGGKPLLGKEELSQVLAALTEALGHARPDQDVALVSSARHEDNTFYSVTAVTARLFVAEGHLNMIVHDARYDFYDTARGTGVAPHFTIGSRSASGTSTLQSVSATNKRADWLVFANAPMAAAAPAPLPMATPTYAPVGSSAAAVTPVAPAPVPDAEQRLTVLKRLFDKGLITQAEYEKKRQEILQGL